jgi:hypothetical protein
MVSAAIRSDRENDVPIGSRSAHHTQRRIHRLFVLLGLVFSLFLLGNVAAPWYACDGKQPGDACTWGYGCGSGGACVLQENCTDQPGSAVNECLICDTSRRPE